MDINCEKNYIKSTLLHTLTRENKKIKLITTFNLLQGNVQEGEIMDKYDYDMDVDAFVLRRSDYDYAYSIDVTSEIILDVDSEKNLIGIEFLDASKVLDVEVELLLNPKKIFAKLISTDEGIILTMKFEFDSFTREVDTPIGSLVSSTDSLTITA